MTERPARRRATIGALLALHAALTLWSSSRESATFDEVPHIAAGYTHLVLGDFHLDPGGHPPLAKMLAAVPLLGLAPRIPVEHPSWRECIESRFGAAFLYGDGDGRRILRRARLPFVGLSLLLGLLVHRLARDLAGERPALVALALFALSPEFLAHAHYANSDLAVSLLALAFLGGLRRHAARPRLRTAAVTALAFALGAVTKWSFLAFLPMGAALLVAERAREIRARGAAALAPLVSPLARLAAASLALAFVTVWATHGFRPSASTDPELGCRHLTIEGMLPPPSPLGRALVGLRDARILPEAYLRGLAYRAFEGRDADDRRVFLAGEVRKGGTLLFFPVALLVKTPLPLLVLAGLGAAARLAREPDPGGRAALGAAALAYLGIAIASGFSLGYRHLLPVLPIAMVLAARGALALAPRPRLLGGLLAWQTLATAWVAPHFLAYFNEIALGPSGGRHWLVDSSTDWGQDLDELARVVERERIASVKLSWFGTASPDAAGIPYTALPSVSPSWTPARWETRVGSGDWVAVSVTNLARAYFPDPTAFPLRVELPGVEGRMGFGAFLAYLDASYEPAGRAGYSILLYHLVPERRR